MNRNCIRVVMIVLAFSTILALGTPLMIRGSVPTHFYCKDQWPSTCDQGGCGGPGNFTYPEACKVDGCDAGQLICRTK